MSDSEGNFEVVGFIDLVSSVEYGKKNPLLGEETKRRHCDIARTCLEKHGIKTENPAGDGFYFKGNNSIEILRGATEAVSKIKTELVSMRGDEKPYDIETKVVLAQGTKGGNQGYEKCARILDRTIQKPNTIIAEYGIISPIINELPNFDLKFDGLETINTKDLDNIEICFVTNIELGFKIDGLNKKLEKEILEKAEKIYDERIGPFIEKHRAEIKKQKTQYLEIIVTTIVVASIISLAIIYLNDVEKERYQNYIRIQQYDIVRTSIVNNIQSFIDASHLVENAIEVGYAKNENKEEFINNRIDELNDLSLFSSENIPMKNALYFYVLSPPNLEVGHEDEGCDFLVYSHIIKMKRPNGRGIETCENLLQDLHLTTNYPSTALETFTNTISSKVSLDHNYHTDLIFNAAMDWTPISKEIKSKITIDNTRFVLVDSSNIIIIDCDKDGCIESMKDYGASLPGGVTPDSKYYEWLPENYSDYTILKEEEFASDTDDFHIYGVKRVKILDGWKLIMYDTSSNP